MWSFLSRDDCLIRYRRTIISNAKFPSINTLIFTYKPKTTAPFNFYILGSDQIKWLTRKGTKGSYSFILISYLFTVLCNLQACFCTETGGAYQRSHAIMIWSRALYPRVFHTSAHVGEAILGTGTVLYAQLAMAI